MSARGTELPLAKHVRPGGTELPSAEDVRPRGTELPLADHMVAPRGGAPSRGTELPLADHMSASRKRSRVLVVGACGRMGERVRAALSAHAALQLGGALEAPGHPELGRELAPGVTLSADAAGALAAADVAVVFATPAATLEFLEAAAAAGVPSVVGTTGFSAEARARMEALAARCALLLAANFSVAVNVLFHLAREAAARLDAENYDAEIVELHHAEKRDAPSGTALRLGEAIAEARGQDFAQVRSPAREGESGARAHGRIGFAALRGGDNPGEHSVLFVGRGERLELTHRAQHRDHFAQGALRAAQWLLGKPPGLYNMEQVLGLAR